MKYNDGMIEDTTFKFKTCQDEFYLSFILPFSQATYTFYTESLHGLGKKLNLPTFFASSIWALKATVVKKNLPNCSYNIHIPTTQDLFL